MWNNQSPAFSSVRRAGLGGLWLLRIRTGSIRLTLPLPLHGLWDLLRTMEDISLLLLPRLGLPNLPALLLALSAPLSVSMDAPLLDIQTGDTRVRIEKCAIRSGRWHQGGNFP